MNCFCTISYVPLMSVQMLFRLFYKLISFLFFFSFYHILCSVFFESALLGRFRHRVAMSVCLRHWVWFGVMWCGVACVDIGQALLNYNICWWSINNGEVTEFFFDIFLLHPFLYTRISFVCLFLLHHAQGNPLDSEMGWTGELWSNRILLILEH